MNNTAIVIPYFGEWPEWFDLYLYSLHNNPGLTVYFFTDIPTDKLSFIPNNAKFHKISFQEYCKDVSEKLNIKFKPKTPYKLCDLKIFLPYIHKDILSNYQFIGWGDIDVVYGNLNNFFSDKIMAKYDYFSVYSCILSGPFTLIRNNPSIYMHFFDMPFWDKMLEEDIIHNIDEIKLSLFLTPKLNYPRYFFDKYGGFKGLNGIFITKIIEIISKVLYTKFHFKELYTTRYNLNNFYTFENGKIYENNQKEIPFLHYFHLKKNKTTSDIISFENSFKRFKNCISDPIVKFQINKNGFIPSELL